jgi:glycerophosphoryl diester phosphodiesterase
MGMNVLRNLRRWLAVLAAGFRLAGTAHGADVIPVTQAHAHNDYEHERPLLDALAQGICSVEADVWLVDGELLVAHDREQVTAGRTLESLYLKPLHERVRANGGRVFRDGPEVTLLIDVKSEAVPTYAALKEALERHADMFTRFTGNDLHTNAIMVIISGNRPLNILPNETNRLAALDGRLSDLEKLPPISVMPLISDSWETQFEWRGDGEFPADQSAKLRDLVAKVHAAGRRIRLWAAPDNPASWRIQREAGVDLINTDKLAELAAWLNAK